MGWKTFKEAFKVTHLVNITSGSISIGIEAVEGIARISPDGEIISFNCSDAYAVKHFSRIISAPASEIKEAINAVDKFEKSIPVYTVFENNVKEVFCEDLNFPTVSHCGEMVYANTHFTSRQEAIKKHVNSLEMSIKSSEIMVEKILKALEAQESKIKHSSEMLTSFKNNTREK